MTYACGLEHFGQAWVVVDAGVEGVDAGFEQLHAGAERGDAALEGGRYAGVHDCRPFVCMNLFFNRYRYCIRRMHLSIVNIRSRPAFRRLNPDRVSPTVCKPATGTTSEGPQDSRRITHLTSNPSTDIPHHSQCLSSARSSPSKLVSNRKRPRERKGGRSRRRSDDASAQAGKGHVQWKRPCADEYFSITVQPMWPFYTAGTIS